MIWPVINSQWVSNLQRDLAWLTGQQLGVLDVRLET